jgi:hypothetical protein
MTERIEAFYSRIDLPDLVEKVRGPAYHKYLIYTDKSGQRSILRAGPDHYGPLVDTVSPAVNPYEGSSFGPVRFQDAPFDDASPDFADHANSLSESLLKGEDLSADWHRMQSAFHGIERNKYPYQYSATGVNSNTIIDATLARSGYDLTRRDGTAGNDRWTAPDGSEQEIISTPGYSGLPPPPSYYERRDKLRGNKKQRSYVADPQELLGLSDEEFARATHGARWRGFWERR